MPAVGFVAQVRSPLTAFLEGQPAGKPGKGHGREAVGELQDNGLVAASRPEPPYQNDNKSDPGHGHEREGQAEEEALQRERSGLGRTNWGNSARKKTIIFGLVEVVGEPLLSSDRVSAALPCAGIEP